MCGDMSSNMCPVSTPFAVFHLATGVQAPAIHSPLSSKHGESFELVTLDPAEAQCNLWEYTNVTASSFGLRTREQLRLPGILQLCRTDKSQWRTTATNFQSFPESNEGSGDNKSKRSTATRLTNRQQIVVFRNNPNAAHNTFHWSLFAQTTRTVRDTYQLRQIHPFAKLCPGIATELHR